MSAWRVAERVTPVRWRAALMVVASAVLVAEIFFPPHPPVTDVTVAPERLGERQMPGMEPGRKPYAAFDQHPLFFPTRTPWVPPPVQVVAPVAAEPAPVKKPPVPPGGYRLIGLVLADGVQTALLLTPTGKTLSLHPGSILDGWVLREVGRKGLRFDAGGEAFELLFQKKS